MSPLRKIAIGLLGFVLRFLPAETREWAGAMLRELDFIESDWAAMLWALGGTRAVFSAFRRPARGLVRKAIWL